MKNNFGHGNSEFKIEVKCVNGRDCLIGHAPIVIHSYGCKCNIYKIISEALEEWYRNNKEPMNEKEADNVLWEVDE